MNFVDAIIGRLGTRPEPFGVVDALIIVAAIALLVGIDVLLAGALGKAVAAWRRSRSDVKHQSDDTDN
jgi:Sec-independent protein translocase protein TatA